MDEKTRDTLDYLLNLSLDGKIDDEQFHELNQLIGRDPESMEYYLDSLEISSLLFKNMALCQPIEVMELETKPQDSAHHRHGVEPVQTNPDAIQSGDIRVFAEHQLDRFHQEELRRQEELAFKAFRAQRRRMTILVGSLSLLLVLAFFAWLAPAFRSESSPSVPLTLPTTPSVVATIAQSVDAQWARSNFSVSVGTRLTASSISLEKGLVQIVFNDGAAVILQAPCDLILKTTGRMVLNRGTVSAVVPPRALGFTIQTPTGIITDHGTEFGVITKNNGATETHVYKGKVVLASVSGISQGVDPIALLQGQAATVDATGQVQRTPFQAHTIVREMPEEGGFAIPGERLSLADVVGGGNGFGIGELGYGIDPVFGRFGTGFRCDNQRKGNGRYTLVPSMPLVDGVFIPDGGQGPIQVSSLDHRFASCPDTSGISYYCLVNGGRIQNFNDRTFASLVLNGQAYGSLAHPAISMHANLGVTFDLEAIRDTLPGLRILRFESLCGISAEAPPYKMGLSASFWILVDGQVRFVQSLQKENGAVPMTVELHNEDRFLTLATTDDGSFHNDYCLFAEPFLALAAATDGGEGGDGAK